ncbi:A disintegrin and metalloproteinase with thrombospondin motifs 13-like [Diadema antillarum]|uniref:A disintegrin and metalloproteinase with thrombospondin motifs 13-like n=1 Tax=Diadema antillarum TaxID=105358 RepID=UPI003A87E190
MSSARPVGVESFKWSLCSAQNIKLFLKTRFSGCLQDPPAIEDPEVDLLPVDDLPGTRYGLDSQCELAYGAGSTVCSSSVCGSLGCQRAGYCHYAGVTVMEGTTCGHNKWCISGECISSSGGVPEPVDGGWSEWEPYFSQCSRTCGTGVRVRRRYCINPAPMYGGLACPGKTQEVELCNMEPCENTTSDDFKNQQCAATDSKQFMHQYYTWKAFLPSALVGNEICKLQCISNANFYAQREPGSFADGTQCWDSETNELQKTKVCVEGQCKEFGCDGTMNSGRVRDECWKCDGSGRTCRRRDGRVRNVGAIHDFKTFLTIPVNSTRVKIINRNLRYTHMSVVAGDEIVFRGEMFIPPLSKRYSHRGMLIKYLANASINQEEIWLLSGPTTETLEVSVILLHNPRYQGNRVRPDIVWEYYTPISDPVTYYWQYRPGGECSASCGPGVQWRRVYCVEEIAGVAVEVSDLFCQADTRPADHHSCSLRPCPTPVWMTSMWSACSSSCGVGRRKRVVECRLNTTLEPREGECDPTKRPSKVERCSNAPCYTDLAPQVDIACNGLIKRKQGYIDQMRKATGGDACTAVITAPIQKVVMVIIKDMNIDCRAGESLEIRIGEERKRLCGKRHNYVIDTHSNVVAIEHKTHRKSHGYRLEYHLRKRIDISACDHLITAKKTKLSSPGWPDRYPPNVNCTYRFVGHPGSIITFRVKAFKLQGKEPRCKHDRVEMLDLLTMDKLVRCGTTSSKYTVRLSGYDGLIRFTSNESGQYGFKKCYFVDS